MDWQYIVTDKQGTMQKGVISAATKPQAVEQLRAKGQFVVSVQPLDRKISRVTRATGQSLGFGRISALDKIIFIRHLSIMLRSGLSLVEGLEITLEQASSKKMKETIGNILKSVSNGSSLAASLEQYPQHFGGIIIGMVKVGEASGTLERNLEYVASELEKDHELRRKVKAAMLYPVIVLSGTLILGTALSIFILPKLVKMFSTFKLALPLMTKIFLGLANFLVKDGLYLLIGLVVLAVAVRWMVKWPVTRPFFHKLNLRWPVLKNLIKNINLARLSRVMSILLKSGVTINESLAITAQVLGNVYFRRELERAVAGVQKGKSLAAVLTQEEFVSKMANRMINVGEKTGKLEESFEYLAGYYEQEVDNTTKNLSNILEPILLVFIGLVLGFLAVAIISPIYQFTGSLSR